jgi:hypothetical protein
VGNAAFGNEREQTIFKSLEYLKHISPSRYG